MKQKQLPELLIDYLNWRSRYVGQRPRTVTVEPVAMADPRWWKHAAAIQSFIDKVAQGDDLTPHLSIQPHKHGYAPAARTLGATTEDRWSDKDFVLNIMGYHHFHLGTTMQRRGHVDRSDDLIFASQHLQGDRNLWTRGIRPTFNRTPGFGQSTMNLLFEVYLPAPLQ